MPGVWGRAESIPNTAMRFKNLIWLGLAVAVLYWVTESAIHTFVFGSGPLPSTLLGEHDPNEV